MNAPWSPGRGASLRDPFAAVACDDQSVELIRAAAADLGWPADKINRGSLRETIQTLSVSPSPAILLIDLSESGDPLADIGALAEVCEAGTIVLAMGLINDVRLFRELIGSGIHDYLLKPLSPETLREAFAQAQTLLNTPRNNENVRERRHLSVAVIGARGGVGATSVATSLAWLFGESEGLSSAFIDLDLHFGSGGMVFDTEPGRGLTDAIENPSRIDGLFLERALVKTNENLSLLTTEAPLTHAYLSDGSAYLHLQEEMRSTFDCSVYDIPRDLAIRHPHLLAEVNAVVLVGELTLVCARDLIRLTSWMKNTAPQARHYVVINKVPPASAQEISAKEMEGTIERNVDNLFPLDAKIARQATKLGKTIAEVGKKSKLGVTMQKFSHQLYELVAEEDEDGTSGDKKNKKSGGSMFSFMSKSSDKKPASKKPEKK